MDNNGSPSQQPEHSANDESFQLKLRKLKGEEGCRLLMDMSSAQAGLTGLMIIVRKYAEMTNLTIYRVLSLLAVGLLGPAVKEENKDD